MMSSALMIKYLFLFICINIFVFICCCLYVQSKKTNSKKLMCMQRLVFEKGLSPHNLSKTIVSISIQMTIFVMFLTQEILYPFIVLMYLVLLIIQIYAMIKRIEQKVQTLWQWLTLFFIIFQAIAIVFLLSKNLIFFVCFSIISMMIFFALNRYTFLASNRF